MFEKLRRRRAEHQLAGVAADPARQRRVPGGDALGGELRDRVAAAELHVRRGQELDDALDGAAEDLRAARVVAEDEVAGETGEPRTHASEVEHGSQNSLYSEDAADTSARRRARPRGNSRSRSSPPAAPTCSAPSRASPCSTA